MEGHASMQRGGYGRTCINEEVKVWKDMHQCRGEGMEGHASMQRGRYGRTCINEEVKVWKDMHQ